MPSLITVLTVERCNDDCEEDVDWRVLPWRFLSSLTHLKELTLRGFDAATFMLLTLFGRLQQLHKVRLAS
jgi:hypothetical protein